MIMWVWIANHAEQSMMEVMSQSRSSSQSSMISLSRNTVTYLPYTTFLGRRVTLSTSPFSQRASTKRLPSYPGKWYLFRWLHSHVSWATIFSEQLSMQQTGVGRATPALNAIVRIMAVDPKLIWWMWSSCSDCWGNWNLASRTVLDCTSTMQLLLMMPFSFGMVLLVWHTKQNSFLRISHMLATFISTFISPYSAPTVFSITQDFAPAPISYVWNQNAPLKLFFIQQTIEELFPFVMIVWSLLHRPFSSLNSYTTSGSFWSGQFRYDRRKVFYPSGPFSCTHRVLLSGNTKSLLQKMCWTAKLKVILVASWVSRSQWRMTFSSGRRAQRSLSLVRTMESGPSSLKSSSPRMFFWWSMCVRQQVLVTLMPEKTRVLLRAKQ